MTLVSVSYSNVRVVDSTSGASISLPGTFEEPRAPVYVDGRLFTTLRGDHIVEEFTRILDDYVASHYGSAEPDPIPAD